MSPIGREAGEEGVGVIAGVEREVDPGQLMLDGVDVIEELGSVFEGAGEGAVLSDERPDGGTQPAEDGKPKQGEQDDELSLERHSRREGERARERIKGGSWQGRSATASRTARVGERFL